MNLNEHIETPEGPLAVVFALVAPMLELGIITQETPEGVYRATSKAVVEDWIKAHGMCDFCTDTNPIATIPVPDFDMPVGRSTGGWAVCEVCYDLVKGYRRADLLKRSQELLLGGRFSQAAVRTLHQKFWTAFENMSKAAGSASALKDFINDELPDIPAGKLIGDKAKRRETIRRMIGLSLDEIEQMEKGDIAYKDVAKKLTEWKKKFGVNDENNVRLMTELLAGEPVMQPGHIPHWQRAIDLKLDAMKEVQTALKQGQSVWAFEDSTDVTDMEALRARSKRVETLSRLRAMGFNMDMAQLKRAEVFSFNAETMHAIRTAAAHIPHESPLSSVEVPKVAGGWYYFAEPFPVASSPASSDTTAAMMWGWVTDDTQNAKAHEGETTTVPRTISGEPVLRLTAWVVGDKDESQYRNRCLPSTKWYWPVSMSFHEMIAFNVASYREQYGPGGAGEHEVGLINEEHTIRAISELSLFFLMSCVWFKQKVIVEAAGHIERHARKRIQKEHKLADFPTIRVIALRKAVRPAVDLPEGVPREKREGHKLTVQFIVGAEKGGFPRLQVCGPGRVDRKLIWVYPFPKGPKGAPWKTTKETTTVYAVVR